ncbi:MAG TPA: hypothetical protein VGH85_06725 [Mycobacteriales bacterium]
MRERKLGGDDFRADGLAGHAQLQMFRDSHGIALRHMSKTQQDR